MEIVELDAAATHDLRRRVLRDGDGRAVVFPEDAVAATVHLGAVDPDGTVVAVVTLTPEPCPGHPGGRGLHLRGMAVEPSRQGTGIGRRLLEEVVARARRHRYAVLWANARDTALGFYAGAGMTAVGEGFVNELGLPHHLVVLDLEPVRRPPGVYPPRA